MFQRKKKLDPLFKHQFLVTGISVFAVVLIALGSSYAIFSKTKEGNEYNVLQVGDLELSYVDLNSEGNALTLNNSYPVSDSVGSSGSSYRFSVENTGNVTADYKIVITDDTDVITSDGCSSKLIDKANVRYKFDNGEVGTLGDLYDESLGGYLIYSSTLQRGESNIHEIRLWLNETSPNEVLGEHYHGKVNVVLEQSGGHSTQTVEGTVININDGYETNIQDLKITGNTVDTTNFASDGSFDLVVTGKNLLPVLTTIPRTTNGVTLSRNADGSYHLKGKATASIAFRLDFNTSADTIQYLKSGETYSISFSPLDIAAYLEASSFYSADEVGWVLGSTKTFATKKFTDTRYFGSRSYIIVPFDTILDHDVYPQIEVGNSATAYEPYKEMRYTIDLKDNSGNIISGLATGDILEKKDGIWIVTKSNNTTVTLGNDTQNILNNIKIYNGISNVYIDEDVDPSNVSLTYFSTKIDQ